MSPVDLHIREARESDAEALLGYAKRLFAEDLPGIFRRPIPTLAEEVEFVRSRIEPENGTLLIAEVGDRPVGLIDLVGAQLPEEAHVGTFGISVDRDWRGRGVGSALIEALVAWAAGHGVTRIQAYVWSTNPRALALYERHGFQREGVCRRAIVRDGAAVDTFLIARLLDS